MEMKLLNTLGLFSLFSNKYVIFYFMIYFYQVLFYFWRCLFIIYSIRSKSGGDNSEPDVQCSHIFQFPLMSWLVFLNCAFFYAAIFTFYQFASVFFQSTGMFLSSNLSLPSLFFSLYLYSWFSTLFDLSFFLDFFY